MTFEESLAKLESIKTELENPDTSFDEAVKLYNDSVGWTKTCLEILSECEGKITAVKEQIDGLIEKPLNVKED